MSQRLGVVTGATCWAMFAVLVSLSSAQPALAASRQARVNRQAQEKAARKACLTGDSNGGVSILADLFVEYKDPTYIFNQGRCLEQNSRFKDAIGRFEEYLRTGETATLDADARAAAQKHIEDCKAKLSEEEKAQVAAPQPFVQPAPQPAVQPLFRPETAAPIVEQSKVSVEPATTGKGLVVAGIVTGGVGVAAVIAGFVLNLKANGLVDDMQSGIDTYTSDKNSSRKTYETLAWVGYGVGAACVATGAVLFGVGISRQGGRDRSGVALVPEFAAGQAGVAVHGGF